MNIQSVEPCQKQYFWTVGPKKSIRNKLGMELVVATTNYITESQKPTHKQTQSVVDNQ